MQRGVAGFPCCEPLRAELEGRDGAEAGYAWVCEVGADDVRVGSLAAPWLWALLGRRVGWGWGVVMRRGT